MQDKKWWVPHLGWAVVLVIGGFVIHDLGYDSGISVAADAWQDSIAKIGREHDKEIVDLKNQIVETANLAFVRGACGGVADCNLVVNADTTRYIVSKGNIFEDSSDERPKQATLPEICTGADPDDGVDYAPSSCRVELGNAAS